jgi:hypothetical protein
MRWLFKLGLLLALFIAVLAFMLALATSSRPDPSPGPGLSMADMVRAQKLWQRLGVRHMQEGQRRAVMLTGEDLALGLGYGAKRLGVAGATAQVGNQGLVVRLAMPVPGLPVKRYFNIQARFVQSESMLAPDLLKVGNVPLPAKLSTRLLDWVITRSAYGPQYQVARGMLRGARLGPNQLTLVFVWHRAALEKAVGAGMGLQEASLETYRQLVRDYGGREFAPLLGQVMALAQERSRLLDPVAENRAALAALAERALGTRLGPGAQAGKGELRLAGRVDFAQHVALSAFLAATQGGKLSNMAGLYKELADTRGGSGFSFNDLAADRAGTALGQRAVASTHDAEQVQARLAGVVRPEVFFPRVDDLPEFLSPGAFQTRYGGVGSPAYQAMMNKIDARIRALPLYR